MVRSLDQAGIFRRYANSQIDATSENFLAVGRPIIQKTNEEDPTFIERLIPITGLDIKIPVFVLTTTAAGSLPVTTYSVLAITTKPLALGEVTVLNQQKEVIASYPKTIDVFYDADKNPAWPNIEAAIRGIVVAETKAQADQVVSAGLFAAPLIQDADELVKTTEFVNNWLYFLSNANVSRFAELVDNPKIYPYFTTSALRSGVIRSSLSTHQGTRYDINNNPVRADIAITLEVASNRNDNNDFLSSSSTKVVTTTGYIDTSFNNQTNIRDTTPQSRYLSPRSRRRDQDEDYILPFDPMFVITRIENCARLTVPATLEVVLLGILNTLVIADRNIWMPASYDIPQKDPESRLRDISVTLNETGAVIPEGEEIHIGDYLRDFWSTNMIYALDVEHNGQDFSALKSFLSDDADDEIFLAADRLFGLEAGTFKEKMGNYTVVGERLSFLGGAYRTDVGYYDIRRIYDYIGAQNILGDSNEGRIEFENLIMTMDPNWSGARNDGDRLAKQFSSLDYMADTTFHPISNVTRCAISPIFIDTLVYFALAQKIRINTNNIRMVSDREVYTGLKLSPFGVRSRSSGSLFQRN